MSKVSQLSLPILTNCIKSCPFGSKLRNYILKVNLYDHLLKLRPGDSSSNKNSDSSWISSYFNTELEQSKKN